MVQLDCTGHILGPLKLIAMNLKFYTLSKTHSWHSHNVLWLIMTNSTLPHRHMQTLIYGNLIEIFKFLSLWGWVVYLQLPPHHTSLDTLMLINLPGVHPWLSARILYVPTGATPRTVRRQRDAAASHTRAHLLWSTTLWKQTNGKT